MPRPLNVFISAAETSGDRFASRLVRAIRERRPDTRFTGIGGARMAEEGVELLADLTGHAVIGFVGALANLGRFLEASRCFVTHLNRRRPDVFVPVDNPGFHLRLAAIAHDRRIPVVYYVSPQVWAWRRGRIHKIARIVDRVLCILPFEKKLYDEIGADARYVGHPALDYLAEATPDPASEERILSAGDPVVGLLPGSRLQEVRRVFPVIAAAAVWIRRQIPGVGFVVACAEKSHESPVRAVLRHAGLRDAVVLTGQTWDIMRRSRICIATSGTATLELAWFNRPMVIVYRGPWLGRFFAPLVLRTRIGLVNVIAGREVCPEFLRFDNDPRPVGMAALGLLTNESDWETQRIHLREVMARVGPPGAAGRAAAAVLDIAER